MAISHDCKGTSVVQNIDELEDVCSKCAAQLRTAFVALASKLGIIPSG